jgi:hypothetical protein
LLVLLPIQAELLGPKSEKRPAISANISAVKP